MNNRNPNRQVRILVPLRPRAAYSPLLLLIPFTLLLVLRTFVVSLGGPELGPVWLSAAAGSMIMTLTALLMRTPAFNERIYDPTAQFLADLPDLTKSEIAERRTAILLALNLETKLIVVVLGTIFGFTSTIAGLVDWDGAWPVVPISAGGMMFGGTTVLTLALSRYLARLPGGVTALARVALFSSIVVVALTPIVRSIDDVVVIQILPYSVAMAFTCVATFRSIRSQLGKIEYLLYLELPER